MIIIVCNAMCSATLSGILWCDLAITFAGLVAAAGYTMSAGVACNKLLAKIASAMHKPNQQTIIPPRCVC